MVVPAGGTGNLDREPLSGDSVARANATIILWGVGWLNEMAARVEPEVVAVGSRGKIRIGGIPYSHVGILN